MVSTSVYDAAGIKVMKHLKINSFIKMPWNRTGFIVIKPRISKYQVRVEVK